VVSPAPDRTGPTGSILLRAFSLTGVAPLGAFLLIHVVVAATALAGTPALAATEDAVGRWPALWLVEAVFVYVPLVVHGGIGAWLAVRRVPPASPSPYPPAVGAAMRWTGGALLAFLALHVVELRFRGGHAARLDGGGAASALAADLSTTWHGVPWQGLVYLAGVACAAFHFAVGAWGFFASSARGRAHPEVRRPAAWAAAAIGVAMWATLTDVVVLHGTGRALVSIGSAGPSEPCPAP
jgi:succinate dehydrogenase / fumarate reductase cytochrome b subunit